MNNWERLTFKLLGLKPKQPLIKYPSWLMKSPTDILNNKYGRQYLIIK